MPSSPAELVKEKLNIVEFLRGYLALQPAGKNFKAHCPFHKEKTPSFMVSPDRQSWHCFGCALGGDVFSFLMRYENVEFGEALRVLAEKAGVELRRVNPAEYKLTGALYEINARAKDFFKEQLGICVPARTYLRERKLSAKTIDAFELGWAPPGPEALTLHLINAGYNSDAVIQAGLAVRTDRGLVIDRFRSRVMFPIHNHFGKVAGFTGRVLPAPQINADEKSAQIGANPRESAFTVAKYVNTPETPVFAKSKLLYGFWAAKNAIRDARSAFVVEGQMDCLMSSQAGVLNVVASSGTAFTADHLKTLRRVADEMVFSFDNDDAGWAAGERAIDLAQQEDFHVKVVTFKDVKDPADAAAADPEKFRKAVAEAKPAALFYFEKYLTGVSDFSERDGLARLRTVMGKIQAIASPVLKDFWFKELARRTGLGEGVLREEAARVMPVPVAAVSTVAEVANEPLRRARSRLDLLSERVLVHAVARGDFSVAESALAYFSPLYRRTFELLRAGTKRSGDPELDAALDAVFLREELQNGEEVTRIAEELKKESFRRRREDLTAAVRVAESRGDDVAMRAALDELKGIPYSA